MTDERRYHGDEIADIFEIAAAPPGQGREALNPADGLTLAELQAIGRDVGVDPARIADAAGAIDLRRSSQPRRTHMAMPISVGQSIDLPRAPTDHEWDLIVTELRRTFHAQGRDASRGNIYGWTNGNLHAYIEPTGTGYRFRLRTLKGDAVAFNGLGVVSLLAGSLIAAVMIVTGSLDAETVVGPVVFGTMGATALSYNAFRLPRWAREREAQFIEITDHVRALISTKDQVSPDPPS